MLIKRLFCQHDWYLARRTTLYDGDFIISQVEIWRCAKCRKTRKKSRKGTILYVRDKES